jgi:hypothetical protein
MSNPVSVETGLSIDDLATQQLRAEIAEINLKIRDHNTPEYHRASFWFSITAATVALVGVIAQGTLSTIRSERASLATERAALSIRESDAKIEAAEVAQHNAELAAEKSQALEANATRRLKLAQDAERRVWSRITAARPALYSTLGRLANLRHLSLDEKATAEIDALSAAVEEASHHLFRINYSIVNGPDAKDSGELVRVFVSSPHAIDRIHVLSDEVWHQLRDDEGVAGVLWDDPLLLESSIITFSPPKEIELKPGAYVFVSRSRADDLIVPEMITIPMPKK